MGDQVTELFNQFLQETDIFKKSQILLTLKRDKGVRVVDISKHLNMKPSYVSHILRLNKLPAMVVDGYYSKTLTPTHLYILARLQNEQQMNAAYEHVLANNLSVYDTEMLVRSVLYGIKNEGEYLSHDEIRAFTALMGKLQIQAKVIQSRIRSKCILEIKGDLLKTSVVLREIMRQLEKIASGDTKTDFL